MWQRSERVYGTATKTLATTRMGFIRAAASANAPPAKARSLRATAQMIRLFGLAATFGMWIISTKQINIIPRKSMPPESQCPDDPVIRVGCDVRDVDHQHEANKHNSQEHRRYAGVDHPQRDADGRGDEREADKIGPEHTRRHPRWNDLGDRSGI